MLHIVQGGIENGDLLHIRKIAGNRYETSSWIVPQKARPGDHVVLFVRTYGFVATARVVGDPKPSKNWQNRYQAPLSSIRLINPPISLEFIRSHLPSLRWARYPRSITTPSTALALSISSLITKRRSVGVQPSIIKSDKLGIGELRALAIAKASAKSTPRRQQIMRRIRAEAIRRYALARANGYCEACAAQGSFLCKGQPYLEVHHTTRRADGGPDHPGHVIGLCANCHRRAHYSDDAQIFNDNLKARIRSFETVWRRDYVR